MNIFKFVSTKICNLLTFKFLLMKKVLILISALLLTSISASAQIFTYTTKIGDYKGPVKSVLSTSDMGVSVDFFGPDGKIQKSINSAKDEYTLFEWTGDAITQKFYKSSNDEFVSETQLAYEFTAESTTVAGYMWDHNESALYHFDLKKNTVVWIMMTENKTESGYNSVIYVNKSPYSKTTVKTFDPDQYGNFTRMVTVTPDGAEHERLITYEYYGAEN